MSSHNMTPTAPKLSRASTLANQLAVVAAAMTFGLAAAASAQQSFTATVDGKVWESDNDGVSVIPVALGSSRGTVTITATSKGFSGYPTPKGFPDSFSVVCPMPKKAERMTTARGSSEPCRVSFTKAARSMMSPDYAKTKNEGEYVTMGAAGDKGYVKKRRGRVFGGADRRNVEKEDCGERQLQGYRPASRFKGIQLAQRRPRPLAYLSS
jgi:hypothetical protein